MNIQSAYDEATQNYLPVTISGNIQTVPMRGLAGRAIASAYAQGFNGCFVDTDQSPDWARTIARYERDRLVDEATFETRLEAAIPRSIQGQGRGKRAVHWNHYRKTDPARALRGSQDYGNCTAWALRQIVGCLWATDMVHKREPHRYTYRPGTAVTYGSRGHRGQGSALSTLVKVVHQRGIQVETIYCNGQYDCRNEADDEAYGNQWGGTGPPQCILDEIKNDRIEHFAYATDEDAIMDVLWAGHFLFHGSTLTARQSNTLISPLTSIGGHAQSLIGYDDTEEFRDWARQTLNITLREAVYINDQSWGRWNTFPDSQWPAHLWGERPEGAWVIRASDLMKIVRQWGDCIAISNVLGFPKLDLDWSMF